MTLELPPSFIVGRRRYFRRSEVEHLKKSLVARAQGRSEPEYVPPEAEVFVNASTVARELGVASRTMARRIRECEERRGSYMPAVEIRRG